jgi:hypothetical protein
MRDRINTLCLYTTIYPGVEPYLQDWYRSVQNQTDKDYQLWIGLDAISMEAAMEAMESDPKATWVPAAPRDTPAQVRQRAFERIVKTCDGVVLVDSDDILHDSRVAAAREALRTSDLAGCALRLVDQQGRDLDLTLGLPATAGPENVFPRNNVFGLSNSAFRSDLLRRCLPIPATAALVDWFLATRAWLVGAKLTFEKIARMDYRQHGENMAQVRPPFSGNQIMRDTQRVLHHFQIVRASSTFETVAGRLTELVDVMADVEMFYRNVVLQPTQLECYVQALNALEPALLWWSSVAHPSLQKMWIQ